MCVGGWGSQPCLGAEHPLPLLYSPRLHLGPVQRLPFLREKALGPLVGSAGCLLKPAGAAQAIPLPTGTHTPYASFSGAGRRGCCCLSGLAAFRWKVEAGREICFLNTCSDLTSLAPGAPPPRDPHLCPIPAGSPTSFPTLGKDVLQGWGQAAAPSFLAPLHSFQEA